MALPSMKLKHVQEEHEDDDDSDASSDDEKESRNDDSDDERGRKRTGVRWTSEEQTAVMNFYGLQTLVPETWADTRDEMYPPKSPSMTESVTSTDSSPDAAEIPPLPMEGDGPVDTSDPLGIKDSILGRGRRRRSALSGTETEQFASLLISSRNFDAKRFLREVHKGTSYRDLELGAERLHEAIEHRQDVIKNLVKTHFAKFVNAKSTIDSFYDQMRTKNLISNEDYGISPFEKSIDALSVDASSLYTPLLDRRRKAEKIRTTLSVLGQWKFFFNLPSVLQSFINKAKYDALVRDYQKGKYLMESSFESNNRRLGTTTKEKDALLPQHHQKVFEKVWGEVERIVSNCRKELLRKLNEPWVPLESQERVMMLLIELNADLDPVELYVERQYEWILRRMRHAYEKHLNNLRDIETNYDVPPRPFTVAQLKKGLNLLQSQEFEEAFASDMNMRLFRATLELVRALCDILLESLPDFWKLCRTYYESRLQKRPADADGQRAKRRVDAKKMDLCRQRVVNIVELYSTLLSRVFFLDTPLRDLRSIHDAESFIDSPVRSSIHGESSGSSPVHIEPQTPITPVTSSASSDTPISPSNPASSSPSLPPPLPPMPFQFARFLDSHPVIICYYFIRIMSQFVQCHHEMRAVKIISEERILGILGSIMDKIKWRAVEAICEGLTGESRHFHEYEDWSFEPDAAPSDVSQLSAQTAAITQDSTTLLKLFYRLHKYAMRCLHRIASAPVVSLRDLSDDAIATSASGSSLDRARARHAYRLSDIEISTELIQHIRGTFSECMYGILDGLTWLGTSWTPEPGVGDGKTPKKAEIGGLMVHVLSEGEKTGGMPLWRHKGKLVDIKQADTRVLVILSNLTYMAKIAVPKLVRLFQEKFRVSLMADVNNLQETISHLDNLLFQNYVKRKTCLIHSIIRNGILFEGIDWLSLPHPQEVRDYTHRALLRLVMVHAQVSDVSRLLVPRVMTELFYCLAQEVLICWRAVGGFSIGGMLQGTLETEFMHQTLSAYETPDITNLLTLVYDTLERSVDQHLPVEKDKDKAPTSPSGASTQGEQNMADMLKRVKFYLAEAKKATAVEFSCFKEKNDQKVNDAESSEDEEH